VVHWIVTPSGGVDDYQFFGGMFHLHQYGTYTPSTLKIEAILSSEMLVTTYKTTRRHNPADHNRPHGDYLYFYIERGGPDRISFDEIYAKE
jgi:hypothetical protein